MPFCNTRGAGLRPSKRPWRSLLWPPSGRRRRDARIARGAILAAFAALFVGATIYAGTAFFQVCYPEDTVASMLVGYRAGAGFEGMYEYEPPNGDISTVPTGFPDACLVTDPNIVLRQTRS